MSGKPDSDKRVHTRFAVALEVRVEFDNAQHCTLKTRDISDSGVFLEMDTAGEAEAMPPPGTQVRMQVLGNLSDGQPPIVRGEVVRRTAQGIGIRFLSETND